VNRDFIVNCRGIGVHPPLKLSAQRINFKATALKSTNFKTIYIINDHLDYEQHKHPVPRIGSGELALVGPTYFEFDVPEICPFKLLPSVGCVEPGKVIKKSNSNMILIMIFRFILFLFLENESYHRI
jgi:hypothetical protein